MPDERDDERESPTARIRARRVLNAPMSFKSLSIPAVVALVGFVSALEWIMLPRIVDAAQAAAKENHDATSARISKLWEKFSELDARLRAVEKTEHKH